MTSDKNRATCRPFAGEVPIAMNAVLPLCALRDADGIDDEITRAMDEAAEGFLDSVEFYGRLRVIEDKCKALEAE